MNCIKNIRYQVILRHMRNMNLCCPQNAARCERPFLISSLLF